LLAPEVIERLVGFDRRRQLLRRFAVWAEGVSGVEVGGRWALGLIALMMVLIMLSSPLWVGVYVALSVGAGILPRPLWLLLALISLASLVWIFLTALGGSPAPAKHGRPSSPTGSGADDAGGSFFRWSPPFGRAQWETRTSPPPCEDTTADVEPTGRKITLGDRLLWAAFLPPVLVVGGAAGVVLLVLLVPFLFLWGFSQIIGRLAEGLRTAAFLVGFLFFFSGLLLQLLATF
jgi:hypothetical protein